MIWDKNNERWIANCVGCKERKHCHDHRDFNEMRNVGCALKTLYNENGEKNER